MKKIFSILLLVSFQFACIVQGYTAEAPEKKVVSSTIGEKLLYEISIKIPVGAEYFGQPVTLVVLKKEADFDYADPSAAFYLDETLVNKDGVAAFLFRMDEPGEYKLRLKGADIGSEGELSFILLSKTDFDNLIGQVVGSSTTVREAAELIHNNAENLNLDTIYFSSCEEKTVSYLKAHSSEIDLNNFSTYFDFGVLTGYLANSSDIQAITKMFSYYADGMFYENGEPMDFYELYISLGRSAQEAVIKQLKKQSYSELNSLWESFREAIILGAVEACTKAELSDIFKNYKSLIQLEGFENLSDVERSEILGKIKSNSSLNSIAAVETYYQSLRNPEPTPSRRPSVTGGSGTGSGGPVKVTPDLIQPDKAEQNLENTAFVDLDSVPWAVEAINYMRTHEIVSGKGNNRFEPEAPIKREEFAKILTLAFSLNDDRAECSFEDVPRDSWYYPYVANAKYSGVTVGVSDTLYGTGTNMTREDVVTMLHRLLVAERLVERVTDMSQTVSDIDEVSRYAKNSVTILYQNGVIQGSSDGAFHPKDTATRAEICQMIYNILKKNGKE